MPTPKASHRTGPAPAAARGLQLALAALLATLLTVVLAPPSTAAYELGGSPHQPTGTASARTAVVMEDAARMTQPRSWATQKGAYRKGRTLTLSCSVQGSSMFGRGSANIPGAFSRLWYRTTDGYYVADVHLDTGSNSSVTKSCTSVSSNITVTTTAWQGITSKRTGTRVAIHTKNPTNGTAVRTQRANSSRTAQKFRFIRDEFGTYRIVTAFNPNQVVTVGGSTTKSTARSAVVMRRWAGSQSQRWVVRRVGTSKYVTLRPRSNSNLCLTVPANGTARLTVDRCGRAGQLLGLSGTGIAGTHAKSVTTYYRNTYGRSIAAPDGSDRGICRSLTEDYLARVYGLSVSGLGDYVPGGGDGAAELKQHGLTWRATSGTRGLRTGDILVFRSTRAGQPGHVGIWVNGRLYDQNNRSRGYFSTARLSPYPVPGMKLVGYWRA
ncbi:RICIN domain-containing protein [Demequina subtropica]|uniref:RICIN domain-containing protein n=1 Tax=Demequina subtropica TaxID=1638989 RepID=UPI00078218E8|nr:RICIN domain-containing protein [Demequina subtropica]